MPTKHKWSRYVKMEDVEGQEQVVKNCEACGMSRTRDRSTKTRDVFRRKGATKWEGFRSGYIPDCVPVQEGK